jgi:hypothetical protein
MEKFLSIAALFLSLTAAAQSPNNALSEYYALKDALVAGNVKNASAQASGLSETIKNEYPDQKTMANEASIIGASKSIEEQRSHFAQLSTEMYSLTKSRKLSASPVYYQYCPMKKAYWLSAAPAIKNPYYGSSMLTCGKVSEVIK